MQKRSAEPLNQKKSISKSKQSEEPMWKLLIELFFVILSIYLSIGLFSIIGVAMGDDDIPYMPFWHEPWRWFFQLIQNYKN